MQKPKLFTSAYNLKTSNDSNCASITAPTADVKLKKTPASPPMPWFKLYVAQG